MTDTAMHSSSSAPPQSDRRPALKLMDLPPEVLEIVIEHVAEPGPGNHPFHIPALSHTFGATPWNHVSAYDLLNLAQTCRYMRRILLPMLWRECHLVTVAQVEHYDAFLSNGKLGEEVYGKLIQSVNFQLTFSHFVRICVYEEMTRVIPIRTCDDMTDALIRIFSCATNMRQLTFDAKRMPITRRLANALESKCTQLHAVKIISEELAGAGHKLPHSAIPFLTSHLQHVDLGHSCEQLRHLGFGNMNLSDFFRTDDDVPFGYIVAPPTETAFVFRTNVIAWWLSIALVGAQNNLQVITMPAIPALFFEPLLLRLWLVLDVRTTPVRANGPYADVMSLAWVRALQLVRAAIVASNVVERQERKEWSSCLRTYITHDFPLNKWHASGEPTIDEWVARKELQQQPDADVAEIEKLTDTLVQRTVASAVNTILHAVDNDVILQDGVARRYQPERPQSIEAAS